MKASIYISRPVLNYQDIIDYARESGFKSIMPIESLHVTVVYCKRKVDWNSVSRDQPDQILVERIGDDDDSRALHNFDHGACVLEIESPELLARNESLRELGIHSKFPDYRAHITITYEKPKGLDISKIAPYRGPILLGPEKVEEASLGWKTNFKELDLTVSKLTEAALSDFDPDALYTVFKNSYDEATGVSWSKEKFLSRARQWTFYGDDTGFVAFREQASGMRKLVGVAGETLGVIKGLKRLQDENKPTWGAVSAKLAKAAKRYGLIAPHTYMGGPTVLKVLLSTIPASVFGGVKPSLNADGGMTLDYEDVGAQTKYFVANKAYFAELLKNPLFAENVKNKLVVAFINLVLSK